MQLRPKVLLAFLSFSIAVEPIISMPLWACEAQDTWVNRLTQSNPTQRADLEAFLLHTAPTTSPHGARRWINDQDRRYAQNFYLALEHLRKKIIWLPPSEKNLLRDALVVQRRPGEMTEFALLALGDIPTWNGFVARTSTEGIADYPHIEVIHHLAQSLQPYQKEALVKVIGPFYRRASKSYQGLPTTRIWELPPQRALNVLAKALLDPHSRIAQLVESGLSPRGAYQAELKRIQSFFKIDGLTENQILRIATDLQEHLKRVSNRNGIEEPTLTLFGSFPNGLAHKQSDVDVIGSPIDFWKKNVDSLTDATTESARSHAPGWMLHVESVFPKDKLRQFAGPSSMMLRIKSDRIELLTFPVMDPRAPDFVPKVYRLQ